MKFWEAMKALEEGKRIRPKGWDRELGLHIQKDFKHWIDTEWELYEEPQQTFSFMEMIAKLKEGKRFRRKVWDAEDSLELHSSGTVDFSSTLCYTWDPSLSDFEATDWIEVKERPLS